MERGVRKKIYTHKPLKRSSLTLEENQYVEFSMSNMEEKMERNKSIMVRKVKSIDMVRKKRI
jgi:hypothetical protein